MTETAEHTYSSDDREDDGRETYRIGVMVYVEAKGVDELDATHRAEAIIRQRLHEHRVGEERGFPCTIDLDGATASRPGFVHPHQYVRVKVFDVESLKAAARNGHVALTPDMRAFW